jgi:signal transduction histidine kinase
MQLPSVPGGLRDLIEQTCNLTRYSLTEARRAIADLRSDSLDSVHLDDALPALAERVAPALRARVEVVGTPRKINPLTERNLLRIVQEALANAARHAGACEVLVELRYQPASVSLCVRDTGVGFEPLQAAGADSGHFGLTGIKERIERIGGSFSLRSKPGEGTELRVEAPV